MRKYHIDGQVFYITTIVYERLRIFTKSSFVVPLYDSLNYYRSKLNIRLIGYVFMPDHIHLLVMPDVASQITDLMRDFKEFTSKRIVRQAEAELREEMNIFSERFLRQKLNYIQPTR